MPLHTVQAPPSRMSAPASSGSVLTREAILRALGSRSEELGKQGIIEEGKV